MTYSELRKEAEIYDIDIPDKFRSGRERKSLEQLVSAPDVLVDEYIKLHNNYLNGDNAKHLFTDYSKLHDPDFDRASGNLIKLVLRKQLALHAENKAKNILFTAGGPGSGKSVATENLRDTENFCFIYDSNLAEFERAVIYIETAKQLDYKITIAFVDRQIDAAYKYGVLQRFRENNPRTVILKRHVNNHIETRKTCIKLYDTYINDPHVYFVIIKNHGEKKDIEFKVIIIVRNWRRIYMPIQRRNTYQQKSQRSNSRRLSSSELQHKVAHSKKIGRILIKISKKNTVKILNSQTNT